MSFLKGKKLPIGHFFVAMAAGLMFFLLPTEAKVQCDQQFWLLYIIAVSAAITAFLLLVVRKYEVVGVALITASSLLVIRFVFETIGSAVSGGSDSLSEELTIYYMSAWSLIWFTPFVMALSVKLFAVGSWNTKEKQYGFSKFLFLSGMALLIIYVMIVFCKVILPFKGDMSGNRQIIIVPFMRIIPCITGEHSTGFFYILWHCILFVPIGFFLPIFAPKIRLVPLILVGIGGGAFLELCQLILNTGSVCLDDILMYTLGIMLGYGLKLMIEKTRSALTLGHDKKMLKLYYAD